MNENICISHSFLILVYSFLSAHSLLFIFFPFFLSFCHYICNSVGLNLSVFIPIPLLLFYSSFFLNLSSVSFSSFFIYVYFSLPPTRPFFCYVFTSICLFYFIFPSLFRTILLFSFLIFTFSFFFSFSCLYELLHAQLCHGTSV